MKIRGLFIPAAFIAGVSSGANALPMTYDFTASNFQSNPGNAIPVSAITGSFTIDGHLVTGIDLTIGSHSYATSEVGYLSFLPDLIGGNLNDLNGIASQTNDFWLSGDFNQRAFQSFSYSTNSIFGTFYSSTGTVTPRPPQVPEPSSLALLAAGILGLGFGRRRFSRK